jgi:hypothetical protein
LGAASKLNKAINTSADLPLFVPEGVCATVPTPGWVLRIVLGMTAEERAEMNRLCERIQNENDPQVFMELVDQLNRLLELKEKRLESSVPVES